MILHRNLPQPITCNNEASPGRIPNMNCSQVLSKLTEIERSIGVVDSLALRRMIVEAQDFILKSQKQNVEELRLAKKQGRIAVD